MRSTDTSFNFHALTKDIFKTQGIESTFVTLDTLDTLGTEKGAYILVIEVKQPINLDIQSLKTNELPAGVYYYVGNAYGSGGIKSRLKRHLAATKKVHWHIDHLTTKAHSISALAVPNGNECDLISILSTDKSLSFPIKGFGSSDCKVCNSHLMQQGNYGT
ncbi:DUF123 domain-containing protein [Kordiimonas sp. SCSIO 12610]|uniref:GIY-YIG nuclease family protein n=1 Tax=Kordiimonas sp. SCSIO 12610 TaxID=2829597 RepID=UPI00210BE355|nr:GIY-YIG nuclease family protein [Kordiimonas sp. SCSIO 12610]UTW56368.1 GIY-YIG nuclease family protein [Kordiimonas sp. SCSIO 12610]